MFGLPYTYLVAQRDYNHDRFQVSHWQTHFQQNLPMDRI